jgi:hypothetical protein
MAAAVLHDVVEDTYLTLDDLHREGFCNLVVSAVDSVTRRLFPIPGVIFNRNDPSTYVKEEYSAFVLRAKENRFGCIIKIKDIEDNVSSKRLEQLPNDVIDQYTIYQMLEQFVDTHFIHKNVTIFLIPDKYRFEEKGFDNKTSFRKDPVKK